MFGFGKKNKENNEEKKEKKKNTVGTYHGVVDVAKMVFKKREYKKEVTKEDKKALILTIVIIIGIGLLLWFLPFTHKFFEDFLLLRI